MYPQPPFSFCFVKGVSIPPACLLLYHARSEIEISPAYVQQLAELDSIYENYGECEFCTEVQECPEPEQAIEEVIAETADLECENIRENIISQLLKDNGSYTEQDILSHMDYCHYRNCQQNREAAIFETSAVRIGGWNAAVNLGYSNMADLDPFYNNPELGGSGYKPHLQASLNAIAFGGYTGTIHQVTDPGNTALYYDGNGQPDPVNGKHLLYTNLLNERAAMGETLFQERLDSQRWLLFRNFYFGASRKIKMQIPAFSGCGGSKSELEKMESLPATEAEMENWAISNDITTPVDSIQVDAIRYMLAEACGSSFESSENTALYTHLEAYFNSNRLTNPFNLLLAEDLDSNWDLQAVEDILIGKGCSLTEMNLAVSSPVICLRDTVVYVGQTAPQSQWKTGEDNLEMELAAETNLEEQRNLWDELNQEPSQKKGSEMNMLMSYTPPSHSEYQALLALYSATNGSGWNRNEGWRDADPYTPEDVTQWVPQGEVNSNGNVVGLRLAQNILSGQIPVEIGVLEHLEVLELERNFLYGPVPSSIGNLGSLTNLNISENNLSGNLPQELSNLNSLALLNINNNGFEGEIPFDPPRGGSYLLASQNKFLFTDLLPFKNNFYNKASYYIQDSVDTAKGINVPSGETLVLTTDIDRNTAPASEYQWFKDGVAVNTRSANGHTHTISNASSGDSGDYYYKIWNGDLPGLQLTDRVQRVLVYSGQPVRYCLEYDTGNAQGGYGQPGTNPSMELYSLQTTWTAILEACNTDRIARADSLKALAAEKLMEERLREFFTEFDLRCLENIQEDFSYTYTPREYHYTLYYYDQSGNLVQTVPPKGVQPMSSGQVDLVKEGTAVHPAHTLPARYRYNSRDQLTGQESPDAGKSAFWYNRAGQLRLSRDARQATEGAYSYTRYDRQGRVTETGEILTVENIDTLKIKINDSAFPDAVQYGCHDITLTFYDRAKTDSDPTFVQENLRGRASWTAMVERDAVDTVFTLYSYDPHGNVNALLQDLPGLGPKRTEYRYDLISGNVNLVLYQYGRPEQFIHRYRYDADNRIEEVHTSTDGFIWNREAIYTYYPHGPLARVELGEYNVQGMDYYYTLQGWLKGINMPMEGDPGGDGVGGFRTGTDAFAFALGYYEGDYKPINPNVTLPDTRDKLWDRYKDIRDTTAAQGLYNGNISWMSTDLPGLGGSDRMQAMVYGYDQLHRIVQARSLTEYGSTGYALRNDSIKPYDVDYSYDANGNLLTLQRRDAQTAVQDGLTYEYNVGTNRLRNTDPADGENYTYDEIGNLISDAEEGIDSISWTPYGKVRAVIKDDDSEVRFRYDATGNRIIKIAGSDTTVYVRDASGNVMGVYKNDTLVEQSIYGSSRLGLMTASSKAGYRTLGGKKYELSSHLGNVLAVVTDNINLDQDSTWASVVNVTDYYPFGLAMEGRVVQDSAYRYGFNGKEADDEVKESGNSYDFGARIYDPRTGRWLSVDPLAIKYPDLSPYNFVANTPIQAIDPDGRYIIFVNGFRPAANPLAFKNRVLDRDEHKYWGGMADSFMDRIGDHKSLFVDGTHKAFSQADKNFADDYGRHNSGRDIGKTIIRKIESGEIILEQGETFKLVSHSQGSAVSAGIVEELTGAGYTVELSYNIAPKQPKSIPVSGEDRTVQYWNEGFPFPFMGDWIAPQSRMEGAEEYVNTPRGKSRDILGDHGVENYDWIFNLEEGREGYVAPKKDVIENGLGMYQLVLMLLLFLGTACRNVQRQLGCLEQQTEKLKSTTDYLVIREALTDTLDNWIEQNVKGVQGLTENEWKVDDAVFFNSKKNHALFILLEKNKAKDAKLDYIKMILGVKEVGIWKFYYSSMPSIVAIRERYDKKEPFSFEELSEMAKREIIRGGYYSRLACIINDSYVEGWYNERMEESHQRFLNNKGSTSTRIPE